MNQPSATITAAGIAGLAMTLFWLAAGEFFNLHASEALVSLSVTFVSSVVGYFKKETVYPNGAPWTEGGR